MLIYFDKYFTQKNIVTEIHKRQAKIHNRHSFTCYC